MTNNNRNKNYKLLLETLRTSNTELDYQSILQAMISIAGELTESEAVSILKYNEADEHLHFIAAPFLNRDSIKDIRVPLDESISGWVYKNARNLVIQNVEDDARFYSEVDLKKKIQTRSILAVPLLIKGQPIGVFEVANKTSRAHYNGEDVLILETLASYIALIVENMTLEKRAEQMRAATDQLGQMKKDFIAIASHELRTPLGLILGHSTFLREVVDEKYHKQLDMIIRSAGRLKEIIENLSSVENFQSGAARIRMVKFSLPNLVRQTSNSFQGMAKEKNISLRLDIKSPDLLIEGDMEKIEIVIANLLKNSLSFTPEGGHIIVRVEQIPGYARVAVIDDGIGIPDEDLIKVFERFYQVESHLTRQHGGMGLGLSVAKVMIELHGGEIWAESTLDKGSQFAFLLPLDRDKIVAAQKDFQS